MVKFEAKGADAIEVSKKLADLPKEKPSVRSLMARAQALADGCKDEPGALQIFDQAVKLYPADSNLLNSAAWFMLTAKDDKVRDAKRALPLAREAVKLTNENDGNILDTLAKALHDSGDLAEAAKYAKLATAKAKDNEEIAQRAAEYVKDAEQRK